MKSNTGGYWRQTRSEGVFPGVDNACTSRLEQSVSRDARGSTLARETVWKGMLNRITSVWRARGGSMMEPGEHKEESSNGCDGNRFVKE